MAYASASQSGYGGNTTVIHTDGSQANVVSISDAELLFTGHLERKGPDLVLTGHDGHHHIIPGYFSAEHHADLVAPNGARITGDLVDLLAGSPAPGQYAQAQATLPTDSIGRIEKVVGDVTVMRNGVAVALHVGDAVYKNDVVQTGSDSSCGIGFPDGTALNLVASTRMALNDYVYDPNGTSNDALFNLVQGGFAFVAGKVAHTGDMKIGTPVATMGIRGTTGYALEQVAAVNANAGNVTMSFAVVADPSSDRVGQYDLIDQFGNVVAQVGRTGIWTNVQFQGPNLSPTVTTQPMTAANYSIEQALVPALVQILNNINNLNPNPQSGPHNPGSSTPPLFELINFQQDSQQNGTLQQTVNVQLGGSNDQNALSVTFAIAPGTPGTPGTTATSTVTWTSPVSGTWETGTNWNDFIPPAAPQYVNINEPVKVTVEGTESAYGLRIGSGAILNIASGATLEVWSGIADFGTLQLNSSGSDPTLAINGTVYLLNGGKLALVGPTDQNLIIGVGGTDATLVNVNNTIIGSGTIGQGDGALTLINGTNGTIEAKPLGATDSGLLVIDTGHRVSNSGLMTAAGGGTLRVDDNVTNFGVIQASVGGTILLAAIIANSGTISASGSDAIVNLEAAHISGGTLETDSGGVIETLAGISSFSNVTVAGGSFIDAGADTVLRLKGTTSLDGTVTFEGAGTFKLEGAHAEITGKALSPVALVNDGTISGAGNIGGGDQHFVLVNERSGTIDASGQRALIIDNNSPASGGAQPDNAVINAGTIEATGAGGLTIEKTTISNAADAAHATGLIEAASGSQILLENATIIDGVVNIAGMLDSTGISAIVNATIDNTGTIKATDGTFTVSMTTVTNAGTLAVVANDGTITAAHHGEVLFQDLGLATNDGRIQATSDGIIEFVDTTVNNNGGAISAGDAGASVQLSQAQIDGGTLSIGAGGELEIVISSEISDATVSGSGKVIVDSGQTLTFDTVTFANVTMTGSFINIGTAQSVEHAVTLSGATLTGGRDDLDSATSTVSTDSTIQLATLQNGTLMVTSGQTLTLNGLVLDNVTLSGGTDDLAGVFSQVNTDSTVKDATLQDGTLAVTSGQTLTLDGVTLGNVTLSGGTDDLYGAFSTVNSNSEIESATLENGKLTVALGQTLTLRGVTLDNVTLSGGIVDLDRNSHASASSSLVSADSTIQDATLQDGTLVVGSGQTLTLDAVTLDDLILFGGTVNLDCATSLVSSDITIEYAALQNGTLGVASDQTLTLVSVSLDSVTLSGGTVDLDGVTSMVSGDSTIENATLQDGTLLVASGQTLTLDNVTLDSLVLFGGTVDLDCATSLVSSDVTIEYATLQNGTLAVASDQILTLDSVTLDDVTLSGGTIDFDGATSTLGGSSNIEGATLQDGTLTVPSGETLTLQGAVTIEPDATIVATGVVTLAAGSTIDNAGVLLAYGGGELDVQNCQINNTGAGLNGIIVADAGSELLVDSATLMLVGYGTVTLTGGGAIVGNGAPNTPDTLVNVDNTIVGGGTIGDAGNGELALVNGVEGTILTEGILIFDTGHTIDNAGLLLALGGGELDVRDIRIDNTSTTLGILIAETGSELLVDTTTLKLVGEGTVTLASGGAIVGNGSPGTPDTLENVDNTILGAGTIGDAGNGELALVNDVNGTIAAYGVLTFATGNTINNAGVLIALQGGELDVQDCMINNTGTGPAGIVVTGTGSELLVDTTTLMLVGDGTVTLSSGGAILGNGTPGAADTLENVDNTITGTGTIGDAGNGELALLNEVAGTIVASSGTLTLDTGNTIVNAGLLQATGSGTLNVSDNIKGAGNIEIGNGATVELGGTATNLVTFEGSTGTLQIDSSGTSCHYSIFGGGALLPAGDKIYLPNISFDAAADSYNANTGVITVSNGTSCGTVTIDVAGGVGSGDTFVFESQGSGTLIYDPPSGAAVLNPPVKSSGTSVSPNGDTFIFHPGMGADIASNFMAKTDTIVLDHFANIGSVGQLTSMIASNAQGDAVIELGHHDSITLPGVSANTLQAHLHSLVHLI